MVRICVTGCLHGELDKVYSDIAAAEEVSGSKTDLVLCCGDFQSLRNPDDLSSMSVPPKYYAMGDFWRYYAEEMRAPILTLFIGGNHEASGYLQELPYGGWVAPNIWYMGYAGVVQFAGLRIAGLSGIYKQHDYTMGHYEHPPYTEATKRSVYHLRNLEVFRLGQIRRPVDIVLSHDWPRGIYHYGNVGQLVRRKGHFRDEINSDSLGSPPAEQLLCRLRPRYWFSAHLHCKFPAIVEHWDSTPDKTRITRFLALDKCLPKRDYLQFLDVEPESIIGSSGPLHVKRAPQTQDTGTEQKDEDEPFIVSDKLPSPSPTSHPDKSPRISDEEARSEDGRHESRLDSKRLFLDPEWLCVLRSTNHLMCINKVPCILPGRNVGERCDFSATNAEIRALFEPFGGEFAVPDNFERTAPLYKPNENNDANPVTSTPRGLMAGNKPMQIFSNPQTELMCAMLDLVNPNAVLLGRESYSLSELSSQLEAKKVEETEDDDEEEEEDREAKEQENEDAEPDVVAESVTAAEKTSPDLVEEKPENTDLPADESGWASAEYSRIQKETVEYDPLETTTVSNGAVYPTTLPNPVSSNPEELQLEDSTDEEEYELENNVASDKAVAENPQHSTERYSPQPVGEYFTGPDDSPDSESVGNYGCVGQSGYVPFVPAGKKAPNPEEIVLSTNDEDDVDYTSV